MHGKFSLKKGNANIVQIYAASVVSDVAEYDFRISCEMSHLRA
jgi:hypothetical protein